MSRGGYVQGTDQGYCLWVMSGCGYVHDTDQGYCLGVVSRRGIVYCLEAGGGVVWGIVLSLTISKSSYFIVVESGRANAV